MVHIPFRSLIELNYRLGATFAFGLPLVLLGWALVKKEAFIIRLLSIYWKVSSLFIISMLLLSGGHRIGYIVNILAPIISLISVWFWVDLNEELNESPPEQILPLTIKLWRWLLSFYCIAKSYLAIISLSCYQVYLSNRCQGWEEIPNTINKILKSLFQILYGTEWTSQIAGICGYILLIIYAMLMIQWLLTKLIKNGRRAGGF